MMGYKVRNLKNFTSFSLETLVPEDNFPGISAQSRKMDLFWQP